jgi:chaperone BCS1
MVGTDAAVNSAQAMEPNGAAAHSSNPAAAAADIILKNQEAKQQSLAVNPDQGLFAQLTSNPFFTAVGAALLGPFPRMARIAG